jgi:hypothetical protein
MLAAQSGHHECVRLLFENGAAKNEKCIRVRDGAAFHTQ